jgi:hypothetical protein
MGNLNGLGGRARTCDLMLPKHLRCQLRYTETRDEEDGSPRRDRTAALLVNSQTLYRLSYRGTESALPAAQDRKARWRRRSDSNRRGLGADGFADRRLRPLGYVAAREMLAGVHGIEPRTFGFGDRRSAS